MKTYKSALLIHPKFTDASTTNSSNTHWYTSSGWIILDQNNFSNNVYQEFARTFFKGRTASNPSNLEEVKLGFDAFTVLKKQEQEEEHKQNLARKRAGQKYLSALMLQPDGKCLWVMNHGEALDHKARGWSVIDIYNYPNHYYSAFEEYINQQVGGSLWNNPKTPAEVEFLFQVFQTDFEDYAAYKKQQRLQEKLAAEEAQRV